MPQQTTNKPLVLNVQMDHEQRAKLKTEAQRLKMSMALVIRQMIDSLPTPPNPQKGE